MDLKQIQYFLAVAEHLNFSRAAEFLYISQPALSYQIAELERELGVELFVRDRRKVFLTEQGTKLLEPARVLLKQAQNLQDTVRRDDMRGKGVLRIGFDQTEDHYEGMGVPQILARFSRENPGVFLSLSRGSFTNCIDQLLDDNLDVAFPIVRYRENLHPDLGSRPVYRSRIFMTIDEKLPYETCEEAVDNLELLLVRDKPRGNTRVLQALEKRKLTPRIRQVDSIPSAFTYTYMGGAIMLLSENYLQNSNCSGLKTIEIPDEVTVINHMAVWNRGSTNPWVHRLLDFFPILET